MNIESMVKASGLTEQRIKDAVLNPPAQLRLVPGTSAANGELQLFAASRTGGRPFHETYGIGDSRKTFADTKRNYPIQTMILQMHEDFLAQHPELVDYYKSRQ